MHNFGRCFPTDACSTPKIAPPNPSPAKPIPQKWIIDTDVAIDDWPAMFFMLNHPQVEVIGITITGCGETHAEPGVQNAMNLCLLAGQGHIPAAAAHPEPLDGYHIYPNPWADHGKYPFRDPSSPTSGTQNPDDRRRINEPSVAKFTGRRLNILSLGPLTNISEVLEQEPALIEKVGKLVIMGGAVRVKGNIIVPGFTDNLKNRVAEWNIYIDPVAAQKVFRSKFPRCWCRWMPPIRSRLLRRSWTSSRNRVKARKPSSCARSLIKRPNYKVQFFFWTLWRGHWEFKNLGKT